MLPVPSEFAYLWFALLSACVWVMVLIFSWSTHATQLWMSACGFIGGPLINLLYRIRFWQPKEIVWWLPIESAIFGGAFIGIVSALTERFFVGKVEREPIKSVSRQEKCITLVCGVAAGFLMYSFGAVPLEASMVTFVITAFLINVNRSDVWRATIGGAAVSLVAYVAIVGGFLFGIADNAGELAAELSSYSVRHGVVRTTVILNFWALTFGAMVGPFRLWACNLRPVP